MQERLINCLKTALEYHASDIHFTLQNGNVRIEMRVADRMRRLRPQPEDTAFFHYLMYRANLDVADVTMPQTGRFEETVDGQTLSLRFALVTSYHMTSGVLRILNQMPALRICDLTPEEDQRQWLGSVTKHRSGLYVFSGPTGSGKTTTLYTLLNETKDRRIFTLEDPVEVVSSRYVQLQINEKQNLSWEDGIRQLMRHDPDIIMIGEIRDRTAAVNAVRCALSGHLVVTSIHAGTCTGAVSRLEDLGIPHAQLMEVLYGITSQRLYDCGNGVRRCIYEIMDRKEILYRYEYGKHSENYQGLAERIRRAVDEGSVPASAAESDLFG